MTKKVCKEVFTAQLRGKQGLRPGSHWTRTSRMQMTQCLLYRGWRQAAPLKAGHWVQAPGKIK